MQIVFHGGGARMFRDGLPDLLEMPHEIVDLPDGPPATPADRARYAAAGVIVGTALDAAMPAPEALRLFHVPGAGYDGVDLALLPPSATLCNCFGHERAIAEYVMGAILMHHIPFVRVDRDLRAGIWEYGGPGPTKLRGEIGSTSLGILGYGHIGKAIVPLARAFGMGVTACTRRALDGEPGIDAAFRPDDLHAFMASADTIVVAVPLNDATRGMVDAAALAAMRPDGLLVNVARGPVVDEQALYDALASRAIGGAVIDTWYRYRSPSHPVRRPSALPFHDLDNVVMTPHMSGWTRELIARRRQTIADNINALHAGRPFVNVVRAATA